MNKPLYILLSLIVAGCSVIGVDNFDQNSSRANWITASVSDSTDAPNIWDVDATVYSQIALPVSIYMRASGMNRILSAASGAVSSLGQMREISAASVDLVTFVQLV